MGTIIAGRTSPTTHSVHPHVRGDNICCPGLLPGHPGSPPRAWGQYWARSPVFFGGRFTPTCVGTIGDRVSGEKGSSVHPHVRGDNCRQITWILSSGGSPPRAWGQYWAAYLAERLLRFTPTCVGTIHFHRCIIAPPPVHPHVRGDNNIPAVSPGLNTGSPPRAWGQFPRMS